MCSDAGFDFSCMARGKLPSVNILQSAFTPKSVLQASKFRNYLAQIP